MALSTGHLAVAPAEGAEQVQLYRLDQRGMFEGIANNSISLAASNTEGISGVSIDSSGQWVAVQHSSLTDVFHLATELAHFQQFPNTTNATFSAATLILN